MIPITDSQLRHLVANLPPAQANRLRDIMMTPAQKQERKELVEEFQMLKTAATIACFISGGLFAIFPNLFVGCLAALVLYGAFEVHTVASNVLKVFEDFTVEARSSKDEQALLEQISKGTCLSRYVIPLIWYSDLKSH